MAYTSIPPLAALGCVGVDGAVGVAFAVLMGVVVVVGDGEPTAAGAAVHDRAVHDRRSATAIAR
ncbi:MAG TPA: hypothetical protein VL493_00600 [Candidatus Saccharimonadales bacterium]|nr:hypothetical protein [Candidatus Saccharimonadales bacterium]